MGTRDPVAFRDASLGLIRVRAHGVVNVRIVQPVLFINRLVGTLGHFTTQEVKVLFWKPSKNFAR
nr:SPFH domain-containing protein [Desulfosoma caldarium]